MDDLLARFYETTPEERERLAAVEALQDSYSPFDALSGGAAGFVSAPARKLSQFFIEAATDPLYDMAINYMADGNMGLAGIPTKRGSRESVEGAARNLDDFVARFGDSRNNVGYNGDMNSDEIIKKIKDRADQLKDEYAYVGLRTADGPPVGDYANSFVWVDGDKTDEILDGISITNIDEQTWPYSHILRDQQRSPSGYYFGDNVYLVGSNNLSEYGQDVGELLVEPEFFEEVFTHKKK